jgi:single-strand DNA-binding protein
MNSVQLFGYLTSDVELRQTPNGNAVANFGVAINRRYRQGEEMKTETTFVDLVAFNRIAEVAGEYLAKGRPVMIEGRLRFRSWEAETGAKRSKLEVVVNQLHLMPRNGKNGNGAEAPVGVAGDALPDDVAF